MGDAESEMAAHNLKRACQEITCAGARWDPLHDGRSGHWRINVLLRALAVKIPQIRTMSYYSSLIDGVESVWDALCLHLRAA